MYDDKTYVYAQKYGWNTAINKTAKFVDGLDAETMDAETLKKCVQAFLTGLKID